MALKDLRLLIRDRAGAFLAFGWPLVLAVFFGALGPIGAKPLNAIEVAYVDEDQSDASKTFVRRVREGGEIELVPETREQAVRSVAKGERAAYMVIPEGFGAAQENPFWGQPARLQLGVDPRRQATTRVLRGRLIAHGYSGLQETFTDPKALGRSVAESMRQLERAQDLDPRVREPLESFLEEAGRFAQTAPALRGEDGSGPLQPIAIEVSEVRGAEVGIPPNPFAVTFTQGIIWAIIACAATFGVSLVNERQNGTLLRLCVAPIGRGQVLAGKALACLLAIVGVTVVLLAIAVFAFGVRPVSWGLLAMAIGGVASAFVGIMMVLAVVGRTAQSAAGLSWAILMVLAMLGGGMLPIFMMPEWLQQAAKLSPVNWALLAMEGAIWRDWSFVEVLTPTLALVGLGAVCFAVGARSFRYH